MDPLHHYYKAKELLEQAEKADVEETARLIALSEAHMTIYREVTWKKLNQYPMTYGEQINQ